MNDWSTYCVATYMHFILNATMCENSLDNGTAVTVTLTVTCMITVQLQLLLAVAVALAVALVFTAVKITH